MLCDLGFSARVEELKIELKRLPAIKKRRGVAKGSVAHRQFPIKRGLGDCNVVSQNAGRPIILGRNNTFRDSMSVPQLVFLPRAAIVDSAGILSPR
jgi:hypothetical protein